MNILGRALARLAESVGGQLMLELPDDLQTSFALGLVAGANTERPTMPPFALLVHNLREDAGSGADEVDFRELAMYRQGDRLAVAFASDNRGMSTYSSVYPMLFSGGFPADTRSASRKGVARLTDLSAELARILRDSDQTMDGLPADFESSCEHILSYLGDAYDLAGSGQTSAASEWWLHAANWSHGIAKRLAARQSLSTTQVFGLAGLPVPSQGPRLELSARKYLATLQARWDTPERINEELKRLEGRESSASAARVLDTVDWERCFDLSSLRSDSPIGRVALCGVDDAESHAQGWALLDEADFASSPPERPSVMRFLRDGEQLPTPWNDATPVLRIREDDIEPDAIEGSISVSSFGVMLPLRQDAMMIAAESLLDAIRTGFVLKGIRGTTASMLISSVTSADGYAIVNGTLTLATSQKTPAVAWLQASVSGATVSSILDRFEGALALVRPRDVAIWLKPDGKAKSKSNTRGPVIWAMPSKAPAIVRISDDRAHSIWVALGDSLAPADNRLSMTGAVAAAEWTEQFGFLFQQSVGISEDTELFVAGVPALRIEPSKPAHRPFSPFAAAARGVPPNTARLQADGTLAEFERLLLEAISVVGPASALGCIAVSNAEAFESFVPSGAGAWCARSLEHRMNDLTPSLPSSELLDHPKYDALRRAYVELRIPERLQDICVRDNTGDLTVSRLPLGDIGTTEIERLLDAYQDLLKHANSCGPSDFFWARNPFSVAVFRQGIGLQSVVAVLLSPLHPIRLAWAWAVQVGLREAFDDGANASSSLALLDGTYFPAVCTVEDTFGSQFGLMPIPIDPHPSDVYLGWHASVAITTNVAEVPRWVAGRRFPVDGVSSISASSVASAIDDFLRVSPHVQSLRVSLEAASPGQRSSSIDDGVLEKIADLARRSVGLEGVAGVRVLDSTNREGARPDLRSIQDVFSTARPGFNVEWVSARAGQAHGSHVTILEGSAAQVAMTVTSLPGTTAISRLPLRRVPRRDRFPNYVLLHFALDDLGASTPLARVLSTYESVKPQMTFGLRVIPNLTGIPGQPQWLVAGDFGVDPQTLAQAALAQSGSRYVLWDWRPVTTTRSGPNDGVRAQPYFIVAAVPKTLNNAIHDRLLALSPSISLIEAEKRVKQLIGTLASRAVGLNTLLAIGHHQATGALGFYFALRSLERWTLAAPDGELRMVVPVDAVDPFLRETALADGDGTRRRADLLAVVAKLKATESVEVTLVPIEIKHYGLTADENESAFPLAGEQRLTDHEEQLMSYLAQLAGFCDLYAEATGGRAAIIGQRLSAIVDAALQLRIGTPRVSDSVLESRILAAIAAGTVSLQLGRGVLLWYQAGARTSDGKASSIDEIAGTIRTRRVDVRVDPKAFDECFWEGSDGDAHEVVLSALDIATALIDEGDALFIPPTIPKEQGGAIDAVEHAAVPQDSHQLQSQHERHRDADSAPEVQPVVHRLLGKQTLESRYASLLSSLSEFGVKVIRPAGEIPYQEGPAFVEYAVSPAYGVSVSRVEAQLDNLKLRLKLPADAFIGCSTHLGKILLTVPKADAERYFVDAVHMWSRWRRGSGKFAIPLGEDVAGNIVQIDLASSNSPHLLIAGVTGSGKSEALLTILHGAARYYDSDELELHLVDPKQTELTSLAKLPHSGGRIGWTSEDAIELLEGAVSEMDRRYEQFRRAGPLVRSVEDYRATGETIARWIIVLDEYADLVSDDGDRKKIEKCLQRLSQKARAAGIHVIVSTQKPVVQVVNTVVKGNLPGRIALRVNTGTESRVVLDEGGAELLVGKGDAIVKVGSAKLRVQFARYEL